MILAAKKIARKIVEKFLRMLVKIRLARTRPTIIGITGSFGKTSTKEAVYEVLRSRYRVYRNPKSLNTEIGLLLAILEQPSGFSSPLKWLGVLAGACINALFPQQYDFLVLEYGADKPGDITHLVSAVKPNVGIITHIARVHQNDDQFKNVEEVFEEKKKLVTCLEKSDVAILNAADPFLKKLEGKLAAQTMWWNGTGENALIYAKKLLQTTHGFSAEIHGDSKKIHVEFSVAGTYHIDVMLPALLCGRLFGISLEDGVQALKKFHLPPGRMSIIEGKNGSTILDGSYNASPQTVTQALTLLRDFPGTRKIAVLGNMNELGSYSAQAHEEIARNIDSWLDVLITVGDNAGLIARKALKQGFPHDRIGILTQAREAGEQLLNLPLHKADVILFKGSQNKVRLERAVEMVMRNPEDAKKLLCRQEKQWKDIE